MEEAQSSSSDTWGHLYMYCAGMVDAFNRLLEDIVKEESDECKFTNSDLYMGEYGRYLVEEGCNLLLSVWVLLGLLDRALEFIICTIFITLFGKAGYDLPIENVHVMVNHTIAMLPIVILLLTCWQLKRKKKNWSSWFCTSSSSELGNFTMNGMTVSLRKYPLSRNVTPLYRGNRKNGNSPGTNSEEDSLKLLCVICQMNEKNILLRPCGHLCLCESCSKNPLFKKNIFCCPMCRRIVTKRIKVYL